MPNRLDDKELVRDVIRCLGRLSYCDSLTIDDVRWAVCEYVFNTSPEIVGSAHVPSSCCGDGDGCCCTCFEALELREAINGLS